MVDAHEFLSVARPALEAADAAMLAQVVKVRWRQVEISRLLRHEQVDVRRVAAVALGLIGDLNAAAGLTRALKDEDHQVNQMAEHGLWSIWFRSGRGKAVRPFKQGVALLAEESYESAIEQFREATRIDPQFAEAYNQCAIAQYLLSRWQSALANCGRTLRLIPMHFGAMAGMGHCYAQLGNLPRALRYYRRTLRINPHMAVIHKAIDRLETKVCDLDASGEFLVDQSVN